MAQVTIELPSMLHPVVGAAARVAVDAEDLEAALRALVERYPAAAVHLFDEGGGLRPHVLCFHNGVNSRWMPAGGAVLRDGDTVTILQAVSGG